MRTTFTKGYIIALIGLIISIPTIVLGLANVFPSKTLNVALILVGFFVLWILTWGGAKKDQIEKEMAKNEKNPIDATDTIHIS